MTPEECEEYRFLMMMTKETHKFAISVQVVLEPDRQHALERLQLKDWIRLIDVSMVAASHGQVMRVFKVMPEAVAWYENVKAS